jgi:hypothetical protein
MIKLIRKGTDATNFDYYSDLINSTTSKFDQNWACYDQLVLETCHMAKFLSQLDDNIRTVQKFEKPDFIIKWENRVIGLEHEVLVHSDSKLREGSLSDLVKELEKEYRKIHPDQKILLTIYPQPYLSFRKVDKPKIIKEILHLIETFLSFNQLPENNYIERFFLQPHSKLSFNCNLGGWWQKSIDNQSLHNAIKKKEKKINEYKFNSGTKEQWLLVVIGSVGESSYAIESIEAFQFSTDSSFDRIFLLEDFRANLYEIK